MRVTRLKASGVHGYLTMDVEFLPDLTFLIGLNGSGKTTALRLVMGLLTPAIDELARIRFTSAELEIEIEGSTRSIAAHREAGSLSLQLTGVYETLHLTAAQLELILDARRREETRITPMAEELQQSPVFTAIRTISTPMFLGLERRFYQEELMPDARAEARRREWSYRRHTEDLDRTSGAIGHGLWEVAMLVRDTMSQIRAQQERLDRELRERLLISAMQFRPSEFNQFEMPKAHDLQQYRKRQEELQRAAKELQLPLPDAHVALQEFLDNMSDLTGELTGTDSSTKRRPRKHTTKVPSQRKANTVMSWLINRYQIDRIIENIGQLEGYVEKRKALRSPVERLLGLLNGFLGQSKKRALITDADRLAVELPDGSRRHITALSSGERQLCVMLGHLTLNSQLSGSGVFIVDEPELSLHLSWQEMFVTSVQAANSDVQYIFATHSPAIILDRDAHCRVLSNV